MSDILGIFLFLISAIIRILLAPFIFIYGIFKASKNKSIGDYFKQIGLANDRWGNVVGQYAFNRLLSEPNGYKAGNGKETISSYIGKNSENGTLTKLGVFFYRILNLIDKNHCENSIDNTVDVWRK